MTHMTEPSPDLEARQLRALLTMSRELMQVDKPGAALALAGRARRRQTMIGTAWRWPAWTADRNRQRW